MTGLRSTASRALGFAPWDTATRLRYGLDVAQMPTFDPDTGNFSHGVKIQHPDAFELTPFTITDGPLKGSHALILKPFINSFRFLDLPAEIRNMVYQELYSYSEAVVLSKVKPRDSKARAVSLRRNYGAEKRTLYGRENARYDYEKRQWVEMPPSTLNLILACRLVREEASAILYGQNSFRFDDFTTGLLFLDGLGNSRQHLRKVEFGQRAYKKSKARSVFHKLKDAKGLRSITIDSSYAHTQGWQSDSSLTAEMIANGCKTLLSKLHKSRGNNSGLPGVADIIHLTWSKCYHAHSSGSSCPFCVEREASCSAKSVELRKLVAAQVGIQE
ncbi:hypothetical protein Slin14017_G034090 [Septoria linicola]|nr:hypothetical protein Slin14017_G034090 [Septoria linicola]